MSAAGSSVLRRVVATVLCVSLAVGALGQSAATPSAHAVDAAPRDLGNVLDQVVPPGARQVLAGIRIIDAWNARNRVYREARGVQRDLRAHYGALLATADRLRDEGELDALGDDSGRYERVAEMLAAEQEVALQLTEDEKRAAKFGFESAFRRQLVGALLQVPKVREGLASLRSSIEEVRSAVQRVRTAVETGNPLSSLIADANEQLARLDKVAGFGELVGGRPGRDLARLSQRLRGVVDDLESPTRGTLGAIDAAIGGLNDLSARVGTELDKSRWVRAGTLLQQAGDAALAEAQERVMARISGEGPSNEAFARAVTNAIVRERQQRTDEPELTESQLRTMSERVYASLLGRSNERIIELCGRLLGAERRAQLAAGSADPAEPCVRFRNPETLQAVIDAENAAPEPQDGENPPADNPPEENAEPVETLSPAAPEPTEWAATMTLGDAYDGFVPFGPQEVRIVRTPGANEFSISLTSGSAGQKDYALTDEGFSELVTFDPNVCDVQNTRAFDGTGEITADGPRTWIIFSGIETGREDRVSCSLEELPPFEFEPREVEIWVEVTDDGLQGSFNYHEFFLPGAPSWTGP